MDQRYTKGEYHISIRITFPDKVSKIIKREKDRFASEYGSKYKSEPHITLYLTKDILDQYPEKAFLALLENLREIKQKPFEITLLAPKAVTEINKRRTLYILDVSYNEKLEKLRKQVRDVANRYQHSISSGLNNKDIKPHITLGEIDFDQRQSDITEVESNIRPVIGKTITVSSITVFFYIQEFAREKATLLKEVTIHFDLKSK